MSRASYQRQYKKANRDRLRYQAFVRREEWRKKLLDLVGSSKCADCGESDYRVLVFDHIGDKKANVSRYLNRSWNKAFQEAQKCEVVCANCHAKRTYNRRPKPDPVDSTKWVRLSKETCPQGHPKIEENIYRWRNKTLCRVCRSEYARRKRVEKK